MSTAGMLLATQAETYVEVLDELVTLLDQALAGAESHARHELSQRLVDRAEAEAEWARLLDEILDVLADPTATRKSARPTPRDGASLKTRFPPHTLRAPRGRRRPGRQITATSNRIRGLHAQIHPSLGQALGPRPGHPSVIALLQTWPQPAWSKPGRHASVPSHCATHVASDQSWP